METNRAASYLEPIRHELEDTGLSLDTTVWHGDPASEILQFARARDVDLVVMATHARGSHSIAALTRVAREVLTESSAPVVLVRPGGMACKAFKNSWCRW